MKEKIKYQNIYFYKIKDYKDYYISKCGKVLSTKRHKGRDIIILKPQFNRDGYYHVGLNNKTKVIHRLMLNQFIPNLKNKPCVNHINGIKNDNNIENLEWCTSSENGLHAFKLGLSKPSKPWLGKFGKNHIRSKKVIQYDLDGNFIKVWNGMGDIKREFHINPSQIVTCCKTKLTTVKGYIWRYYTKNYSLNIETNLHKICLYCNKKFKAKNFKQKYCCSNCYKYYSYYKNKKNIKMKLLL